MNVDKKTFSWGTGCFMRCMGSCTVLWSGQGAAKQRATIINGHGLLCEDAKVPLTEITLPPCPATACLVCA